MRGLCVLLLLSSAWAQGLPDAPKPQRTIDKEFAAMAITHAGFMGLDLGMSIHRISNSHNPCVVEVNPMFGPHPSAGRYAAVMLPAYFGTEFLGYELKKHHSPVWALPASVLSVAHFVGFVSNTSNMERWSCNRA